MAGLIRDRTVNYQRVPGPEGMTGEEASTVYRTGPGAYPELPMPATHFVTSTAAIKSNDPPPSVGKPADLDAAIGSRKDKMTGYTPTGGHRMESMPIPQMYNSPPSSKYQEWFAGPIVNYVINLFLYRAGYPAATVMNGGRHNLALSTRVDQLVTRTSGGPGKAQMTTSQRRFNRVQQVPRYSTMPRSYPTQSAES